MMNEAPQLPLASATAIATALPASAGTVQSFWPLLPASQMVMGSPGDQPCPYDLVPLRPTGLPTRAFKGASIVYTPASAARAGGVKIVTPPPATATRAIKTLISLFISNISVPWYYYIRFRNSNHE